MPCKLQGLQSQGNIALVSYDDDKQVPFSVLTELPFDLVRNDVSCLLKELMLRKLTPFDCILKTTLLKIVLNALP